MAKEKLVSYSSGKLPRSKSFKYICNTLTSPPSEDDGNNEDERNDVDMRATHGRASYGQLERGTPQDHQAKPVKNIYFRSTKTDRYVPDYQDRTS